MVVFSSHLLSTYFRLVLELSTAYVYITLFNQNPQLTPNPYYGSQGRTCR